MTRGCHYYSFPCPTPLFSCLVDIHSKPVVECKSESPEYVTIHLHCKPQAGGGSDRRRTHQEKGNGIHGGVHFNIVTLIVCGGSKLCVN